MYSNNLRTKQMKLSIKENSKNYACSVVEIKDIFPIPYSDNIVRVVIRVKSISSRIQ